MTKLITNLAAWLILTWSLVSAATADGFGTGLNQFDIEFVTIGNPGNPDDTAGDPNPAGSVAYTFRMGKFEVSEDMITKFNAEFGTPNSLVITKDTRGADKPVTSVTWNEAARFVNWLNTSTGGTVAYKFTTSGVNDDIALWTPADTLDYDAANPFRSKRANYVLPSVDEWYKAAYYNPATGQYGDYPTSDGTVPTAVASGTADKTAVYDQPAAQGPADITQAGGLSAYGIMGLGGNVFEREETTIDLLNSSGSSSRGVRGGSWEFFDVLSSSNRFIDSATNENPIVGFRVASLKFLLGDANGDGVLNNNDIADFALALFNPPAYAAAYPDVDPDVVLDMNDDGVLNNLDIAVFATALGL